MDANSKTIIDFLKGCEYVLIEGKINTVEIFSVWEELFAQGMSKGFVPLVIAPCELLVEQIGRSKTRESILDEAEDLYPAFVRELNRLTEIRADKVYGKFGNKEQIADMIDASSYEMDIPIMNGFGICEDYHEALIAKIPTEKPWEVPAWLPMGGWNECPAPAKHVAFSRHWYEKYSAVPCLITRDILNFYVPNPPTDIDDLMTLAREHYAFCNDSASILGEIGFSTLFLKSRTWHFWWD